MQRLTVPQGAFDLGRYPARAGDALRAWDAADELVLGHLAAESVDLSGSVLIVNDSFGALSVALAAHRPTSFGDSFLADRGTTENLLRNGVDPTSVARIPSTQELHEHLDVLLVKVPKSLTLLEDQLRRVAPWLRRGSVVVGAGMTKQIHTSTLELFERLVGPTRTSLATRKARLIFSAPRAAATTGDLPDAPLPAAAPSSYTVSGDGWTVEAISLPGVFAGRRLDRGTELLLAHLPEAIAATTSGDRRASIVDLGCGNGVVGTVAARLQPDAELTFVDESYAAVASAAATFRANLGDGPTAPHARFVVGDGLAELATPPPIEAGAVDLVLVNPPFHTSNAKTDAVAWSMFTGARAALRRGGELWVVGNRHLAYHAKLRRLFGNGEVVASNPKFVLLRVIR